VAPAFAGGHTHNKNRDVAPKAGKKFFYKKVKAPAKAGANVL